MSKKSNEAFLSYYREVYYWAIYGCLLVKHQQNENFPEKSGSVTFGRLWAPNLMQNNRKF